MASGNIACLSSEEIEGNHTVVAPSPTPTPTLTKKDRKKLKKLKKRVHFVQNERSRSGLLTRPEYDEYKALVTKEYDASSVIVASSNDDGSSCTGFNATTEKGFPKSTLMNCSSPPSHSHISACTSVNLRKRKLGTQTVEGVHHRDLLVWLLQQKFDRKQRPDEHSSSPSSSTSKKRGRVDYEVKVDAETMIPIPHCYSVHNPGMCEQVAVLDIDIAGNEIELYSHFLEAFKKQSDTKINSDNIDTEDISSNQNSNSRVGLVTKWFQGHLPKYSSESMLYFNARKDQNSKVGGRNEQQPTILSKEDILQRLESMLLPTEDMIDQGYPKMLPLLHEESAIFNDSNNMVNCSSRKEFLSPDSIPIETAKTFVEAHGVRVEDQEKDDKTKYISTQSTSNVDHGDNNTVRVLGLDCEMVRTVLGSELARVTLLQFDEHVGSKTNKMTVLLDCLVLPNNRILDYLTTHSGITPSMLEPISTRLEQVQYALASYLTPRDILVGHSLENDLRALHYIHPRIIDTSMIFRPKNNERFKYSLRHLSGTLLKRKIQNGSHCSEEDAKAALDLAILRAVMGDQLQVPGSGNDRQKSLLQKEFVRKSIAVFIGPNPWLLAHVTNNVNSAHALTYDSPNDCKKAMLSWMTGHRKAHLIWSKISLKNDRITGSSPDTSLSLQIFKSLVVSFRFDAAAESDKYSRMFSRMAQLLSKNPIVHASFFMLLL